MSKFNINKSEGNILTGDRTGHMGGFLVTAQTARIDFLKSMWTLLSEGRVADFVGEFDADFTFADHALDLQFSDKDRLTEFLQKSRELFPDSVIEVVSAFESGDTVMAEWGLTATETASFFGSTKLRLPISFSGVTIVQFRKNKISQWSDYYDQLNSRRTALAAAFANWVEY
jgi:steroid delta-isomerase-like uncharacterized protein